LEKTRLKSEKREKHFNGEKQWKSFSTCVDRALRSRLKKGKDTKGGLQRRLFYKKSLRNKRKLGSMSEENKKKFCPVRQSPRSARKENLQKKKKESKDGNTVGRPFQGGFVHKPVNTHLVA